jgi:hypothetical protein
MLLNVTVRQLLSMRSGLQVTAGHMRHGVCVRLFGGCGLAVVMCIGAAAQRLPTSERRPSPARCPTSGGRRFLTRCPGFGNDRTAPTAPPIKRLRYQLYDDIEENAETLEPDAGAGPHTTHHDLGM